MAWLVHTKMMIRPGLAALPVLVVYLVLLLCVVLSACDAADSVAASDVPSVDLSAADCLKILPLIHHYLREVQIVHHEHANYHHPYRI